MIQALRTAQASTPSGHISQTIEGVPLSFGNDAIARQAAQTGIALYDRCHWGRIAVTGADRLRFLHNQTTNAFSLLQPGQGCETVFVNSTGRTIDLVSAYVTDDAVLLLTAPGYSQRLIRWMDRYIFFADKVGLQDVTETTAAFSLLGDESHSLMEKLGAGAIVDQFMGQPQPGQPQPGQHQVFNLNGIETRVAVGSGLALPGYTLIVAADVAVYLWQALTTAGAEPLGENVWHQLRVAQGRPMPDCELTEDYNPLEAGLWHTISLSKGCYIGQETIARLHTYRGVKQQLWGVRLNAAVAAGSPVTAGDEKIGNEKIGTLTSCVESDRYYLGLAYIRTKAIEAGVKTVRVGEAEGELVALPFVSHEYI